MSDGSDQQAYNQQVIAGFRASGRGTTGEFAGRPLLLLTTTGRRTGQARTTPMMYVPDGDRVLVLASNAGAPEDPDWYRNLVADPSVTVEVAGEQYPATASTVQGEERERLWTGITADYPFFVEHQAGITRQIPVVALERN